MFNQRQTSKHIVVEANLYMRAEDVQFSPEGLTVTSKAQLLLALVEAGSYKDLMLYQTDVNLPFRHLPIGELASYYSPHEDVFQLPVSFELKLLLSPEGYDSFEIDYVTLAGTIYDTRDPAKPKLVALLEDALYTQCTFAEEAQA